MGRILNARKRYLISVITDINLVIIGCCTKSKDYCVLTYGRCYYVNYPSLAVKPFFNGGCNRAARDTPLSAWYGCRCTYSNQYSLAAIF